MAPEDTPGVGGQGPSAPNIFYWCQFLGAEGSPALTFFLFYINFLGELEIPSKIAWLKTCFRFLPFSLKFLGICANTLNSVPVCSFVLVCLQAVTECLPLQIYQGART